MSSHRAPPTSRWRTLGGSGWSRGLGSRTSGSPSAPTAGEEPSGEGSIEAPRLTATVAATAAEPVVTGFSWERSSDGDDGGDVKDIQSLAGKTVTKGEGNTVPREYDEDSQPAEKQRLHPLFPPMPPIPPAPRSRNVSTGSPPSVPATSWGKLDQDRSVCEAVPPYLLPNHCTTALIGTTPHGFPLGANHHHRSEEEGEQPRNGNWRSAGEVHEDDPSVTGGRLGNVLLPPPFLSPVKEEAEEEQEHGPAESTDWGRDGAGVHDRETRNFVRKVADVVPLEETAMTTGAARIPSFVEDTTVICESMPARSVQQELEEEREDGFMNHRPGRHRVLHIADTEEEADASSLVPREDDDDDKARKRRLELGKGEEGDSGARGERHAERRHASCTRADNGEAVDRFCRRDGNIVLRRGREAEEVNGKDEAQSAIIERDAAEREESEEESDSSYRRDCAVLAGTAKIVFALLALEHRGVSSRFYRWKRTRNQLRNSAAT